MRFLYSAPRALYPAAMAARYAHRTSALLRYAEATDSRFQVRLSAA
jgi:hypothetical protein